jgi:hypothetical protein
LFPLLSKADAQWSQYRGTPRSSERGRVQCVAYWQGSLGRSSRPPRRRELSVLPGWITAHERFQDNPRPRLQRRNPDLKSLLCLGSIVSPRKSVHFERHHGIKRLQMCFIDCEEVLINAEVHLDGRSPNRFRDTAADRPGGCSVCQLGCDLTLPYVLAAGARNSLCGMFLCHWLPTNRTLSAPHILRNLISSASDYDFAIQCGGYDKKALPVVAPGQHRRITNRLGSGVRRASGREREGSAGSKDCP